MNTALNTDINFGVLLIKAIPYFKFNFMKYW